jgi:hypothetical protein
MDFVSRFDFARLPTTVITTPQGFVRIPAHFTRAGVFTYLRADGSKVRELRPESEVFSPESMSTLAGSPVVVGHPAEQWVSPKNAKALAVGWAAESVDRKDSHLVGAVTIMDDATIARAGKELREISMGYRCRIDAQAGVDEKYGAYDQVQRNIRYNHVALGPEGWGRAGPDVGLRLDSTGARLDDTLTDFESTGRLDTIPTTEAKPVDHITINGVEFEVSKACAQAYRADQKRLDSQSEELAKIQGTCDAQKTKIEKLEKDLKEANDPKRLDSAVSARVALVAKARRVLGEKAELPAEARKIHELVIKHDNKDLDLSGKSDAYVEARFDAMLEGWQDKKADDSKRAAAATASGGQPRTDAKDDPYDSKAARERMIKRLDSAWKGDE